MSDFPAYQAPPRYQGIIPSHVPSVRVRSVVALIGIVVATLAACTAAAALVLPPNADLIRATTGVDFALYLVAGVAFVLWLHRVRVNLSSFGVHHLRYSPGWTIGGWFIPLGNLVMPLLVVSEIDKAMAERTAATAEPGWGERDQGRPIFVLWAVFWTLRTVASYAQAALLDIAPMAGAAISIGIELGAGVCAVLLILRITNSHEKLRNSEPVPSAPVSPVVPLANWPG